MDSMNLNKVNQKENAQPSLVVKKSQSFFSITLAIITQMKKHYFISRVVGDVVQPTMPLRWHLRCIVAGLISIVDPPVSSCKPLIGSCQNY